ncbi:MAG TPA: hypothetical protein VFE33_10510 [Thermoanaerobaculia bacterium]|nr:hypothetical protein [Thermoanaerobaculia bacterium]
MRSRSILALALFVGLLVAVAAFASPGEAPTSPNPDFPVWLAAASGDAVGTPAPLPMAFLCQPNGTFCQQAQCACQQHGGACLCGGTLLSCNQFNHTFSCLCKQC